MKSSASSRQRHLHPERRHQYRDRRSWCWATTPAAAAPINLSGGSLSASRNEVVGVSGSGAFTQSGGTNTVAGTLILGYNSGSSGTYNLSGRQPGGASMNTSASPAAAPSPRAAAPHTVTDLYLGDNAGGSGTYNLSGGSLCGRNTEIHRRLRQRQPSPRPAAPIRSPATSILGDNAGGSGTYNLSGGSLAVGGNEYIGNSGSGAFTQSGGTNTVTGDLYLGYQRRRQRHLQPERRQPLGRRQRVLSAVPAPAPSPRAAAPIRWLAT